MKPIRNLRCSVPVLFSISICTLLFSCKNEQSGIGNSFFESHANVVTIDTMTVDMETVWLDSVPTSGTGVVLVGAVYDSASGNREASSYLQLGAPAISSVSATAVYDSLCFLLKPDTYVAGDSTRAFSLAVHRLNELIAPAAGQTSLYNTSSFSFDPAPVGTWTGMIYPARTDSISVRLSDSLGNNLFSAIVNHPGDLSTDALFAYNYLKGFVLTGNGNSAVYGFGTGDSSALMRLYYHNASDARTVLHADFKIAQSGLQFNHIDEDMAGTPFAGLGANNKIVSSRVSRVSAVQPLGNLAIRLNIPYIQNLEHLGRYVQILSSRLTVRPKWGTYSATNTLPPFLTLCQTQNYYTVVDSLADADGSVQHGSLVKDYLYGNSYYTYDITRYLLYNIQVANNYDKTQLLLIPPLPAYNTSLQQLVVDNESIEMSVQLVLYNTE